MALTHEKQKYGQTFESAYTRVKKIDYTQTRKDGVKSMRGQLIVETYYSEGSRDLNESPLETNRYQMEFINLSEEPNLLKQAYDYLKTLPEFEGSTDVIEEDEELQETP